jgi:hypothetical protein
VAQLLVKDQKTTRRAKKTRKIKTTRRAKTIRRMTMGQENLVSVKEKWKTSQLLTLVHPAKP